MNYDKLIYQTFKQRVRTVTFNEDTWYLLTDVQGLIEDDRHVIRRVLDRLVNGDPTAPYKDLIQTLDYHGQAVKCLNGIGVFRLLQDVKGTQAEAIRRAIAESNFEFAKEQTNPELAIDRAISLYRLSGRDDKWIKARMQNVHARHQFTDRLKDAGIKEGWEYAALTNVVHEQTFDLPVREHKAKKSLTNQNLRDHMSELELTLITLGEQASTELSRKRQATGYKPNLEACTDGGKIAGDARKAIEVALGESVVTGQNFLPSSSK